MIEERELDEFELDCIAISQIELTQNEIYSNLLQERKMLHDEFLKLCTIQNVDSNIVNIALQLMSSEYQIAWWSGQAFQKETQKGLKMIQLTEEQIQEVSGGKFKWHVNIFQTVFTAIGAFMIGGPVTCGMVIAAAVAAQGAGNLHQMYADEFGNIHER